jgi:myo-inositol-1-phosphate synthase
MQNDQIRLALVGVGNCASSLVQGLTYYQDAMEDEPVPGLMHVSLGGYHVRDVKIVAAFDVSAYKVGLDVAEAVFARPNNTIRFSDVPKTGAVVQRGPMLDGIGRYLRDEIPVSEHSPVDVAAILKSAHADIVVSYLPVGSEEATRFYAEEALQAGCGFVNCIPVFIASDPVWARKFEDRGLPIIGDDIKSQVGATILHRLLANVCRDRGVRVDRTYQLNFGGNTDFLNMLERDRLESKKRSKTQSVVSQLGTPLAPDDIHVGPSDHVPWLADRKFAYIRVEATTFGNVPLNMELKLEVWDSPNSAGVVIDAVRCAKLALDRGIGGALTAPSSYFMKSPPIQFTDAEARSLLETFISDQSELLRGAAE